MSAPSRFASQDRALHDRVIRYLTDVNSQTAETSAELLEQPEAMRARRFSRFLARRYYRDRLNRGFRYSASLLGPGSAAERVVDCVEFESILGTCVLGSLTTSAAVADLALRMALPKRNETWWSNLLEYERALFLQLATSQSTPPTHLVRRSLSSVVRQFEFRMPELVGRLQRGEVPTQDLQGSAELLFSRTPHGKIYVVELDAITTAVLHHIDGQSNVAEVARSSGVSVEDADRTLSVLTELGAVVMPSA